MEVSSQLHAPAILPSGKEPANTLCGKLCGPRNWENTILFIRPEFEPRIINCPNRSLVTTLTELPWSIYIFLPSGKELPNTHTHTHIYIYIYIYMGRGSSVSVVTRLRFGQLMIQGSNSGRINKFVFSQFQGPPTLPLSVFASSFPEGKKYIYIYTVCMCVWNPH